MANGRDLVCPGRVLLRLATTAMGDMVFCDRVERRGPEHYGMCPRVGLALRMKLVRTKILGLRKGLGSLFLGGESGTGYFLWPVERRKN